jgi:hypothetical protein
MPRPLMKFNPGFQTDSEIIDGFLVRESDLAFVLDALQRNTDAPVNEHLLIVGPRGMGKTTLVLRAVAEVRRPDSPLGGHWYPIVFGEESYAVGSAGELWLEALFHVAEQTRDARWQSAYDDLKDERDNARLLARALSTLLDFADEQGKRLLLVIENLQMLLGDQLSEGEAWALRRTLQGERRVMVLATATSRFDQVEQHEQPMFDLFRLHDLRPLDEENCGRFWVSSGGTPLSARQARPIRILTGGNPRLLAIIAAFAAHSSFRDLMDDLVQLVDDHTDYFKSHLDGLAPAERRVFVALAELWDPSPARAVARAARTDSNKASAELARLTRRGAVTTEERRKTKYYQVAERMYNIYYLMRRRGGSSDRVKALVRFMLAFYDPGELVSLTSRFAGEARLLPESDRADHRALLDDLWQSAASPGLKQRLREAAAPVLGVAEAGAGSRYADLADLLSEAAWSSLRSAARPYELLIPLILVSLLVGSPAQSGEAVDLLPQVLAHPGEAGQSMPLAITLFVALAAAGQGPAVLRHLQESPSASLFEPLIAALRLDNGEDVVAPQEVMEVARDIVADIEKRRAEIAAQAEPAAG